MKVQYIIPGFDPAAELAAVREPSAFRMSMGETPADVPVSWKQVLGLDRTEPGSGLQPPSRPPGLTFGDIDQERERWSDLMSRHLSDPPDGQATRRMLALLLRYREAQADVRLRSLSEGAQ